MNRTTAEVVPLLALKVVVMPMLAMYMAVLNLLRGRSAHGLHIQAKAKCIPASG